MRRQCKAQIGASKGSGFADLDWKTESALDRYSLIILPHLSRISAVP